MSSVAGACGASYNRDNLLISLNTELQSTCAQFLSRADATESEPGLSPWHLRQQVTKSASLLADALVGYLPRYDVDWIVQFQDLTFDNTGAAYKQVRGQVVVSWEHEGSDGSVCRGFCIPLRPVSSEGIFVDPESSESRALSISKRSLGSVDDTEASLPKRNKTPQTNQNAGDGNETDLGHRSSYDEAVKQAWRGSIRTEMLRVCAELLKPLLSDASRSDISEKTSREMVTEWQRLNWPLTGFLNNICRRYTDRLWSQKLCSSLIGAGLNFVVEPQERWTSAKMKDEAARSCLCVLKATSPLAEVSAAGENLRLSLARLSTTQCEFTLGIREVHITALRTVASQATHAHQVPSDEVRSLPQRHGIAPEQL